MTPTRTRRRGAARLSSLEREALRRIQAAHRRGERPCGFAEMVRRLRRERV